MADEQPFISDQSLTIRQLAQGLGSAKRHEILQNNSGLHSTPKFLNNTGSRKWTDEEDRKLFRAARKYGNSWAKIVSKFEDRTQIEIKKRWEYFEGLAQEKGMTLKKTNPKRTLKKPNPERSTKKPPTPVVPQPACSDFSTPNIYGGNNMGDTFLNGYNGFTNGQPGLEYYMNSITSQANMMQNYGGVANQFGFPNLYGSGFQASYPNQSNFIAADANPFYTPTRNFDDNDFLSLIQACPPAVEEPPRQEISEEDKVMELATKIYKNPQLIELLSKITNICTRASQGAKRNLPESRRPTKRGRFDKPPCGDDGSLLLYQLANTEFPEELEDDVDFEEEESDLDSDGNFKPNVSDEELKELIADSKEAPEQVDDDEEGALFTQKILRQIRSQQKQNLQLVLQAYSMECSFRGPTCPTAEHWKNQAVKIKQLNDYGAHRCSNPRSSNSEFLSFFTVAGAQYIPDILAMMANPPENIICLPTDVLRSQSRPLTPTTDKGRSLAYLFPDDQFAVTGSPRASVEKARLIYILCKVVMSPIFVESILPYFFFTKKRERPIFSSAEDDLFLIALERFSDDWASIRSHILPVRSDRQLENRFNNMKSRRIIIHPIQIYHTRVTQPLTEEELAKLLEGVKKYGKNFRRIQQNLLPARPSFFLKKAFRDLNIRKSDSKPSRLSSIASPM